MFMNIKTSPCEGACHHIYIYMNRRTHTSVEDYLNVKREQEKSHI
jgi:hypothetical protein